jgi:hypothetical protein
MASNLYKSWWGEMGAISRGMMFIEGNLADSPSVEGTKPLAEETRRTVGIPASARLRTNAHRLYRNFLLLGGRPVTAGHHDDIDEPFPSLEEEEPAPRDRPAPPARTRNSQTRTCAAC